jgi:hypothetical protein
MQEKEEITAEYGHNIYFLFSKSGLPLRKRGIILLGLIPQICYIKY